MTAAVYERTENGGRYLESVSARQAVDGRYAGRLRGGIAQSRRAISILSAFLYGIRRDVP